MIRSKRPEDFRIPRRSLLRTLSVGAAGMATAKVVGLVPGERAVAAALPPGIRRFVFIYTPNGTPENLSMTESWCAPGATATDYKLVGMTAPLERHKGDLVFLGNLALSASEDFGNTHTCGQHIQLTATRMIARDKDRPVSESMDNYLGRAIGKMVTPQWPSLVAGIAVSARETTNTCSHAEDGSPIVGYRNPWELYKTMFGNIVAGADKMTDPALLRRLARRQSVLDNVIADLTPFTKSLPAVDRVRADAQLEAIRTLEKRLSAPMTSGSSAKCGPPNLAAPINIDDGKNAVEVGRAQYDVITAAFACDLTRFVAVTITGNTSQVHGFLPWGQDSDFHAPSHFDQGAFLKGKTGLFDEIAKFIDRLKGVPEGDGTMLDNTLVLVTSEIGRGHTNANLPWLLIGGKNLGVKTGQYLKLPKSPDHPGAWPGFHHGRLLSQIVNLMGLPDPYFGLPEYVGGVPGLLAG